MPSVLARVDDDLTLRVPQFFCCNCGEVEEIRSVTTLLSKANGWKAGSRFVLALDLPYCKRCAGTAAQAPTGPIKKTLVALILSVSAGMLALITPLRAAVGALAFFLVAVPVFALIFAAYARQKASGNQTSDRRPVSIVQVDRDSSGKVSALTLSFTHVRYAQAFAAANKEEVARGVLEVAAPGR